MHPVLTASSENSLRSAFVQFLATSSENKEYCLASGPINVFAIPTASDQRAMVDSLERKKIWYRTDAEE
jgi:hypothetical protein